MGLDNYWMFLVGEGKTAPTIDWEGKEPNLIGGLVSANGMGSFRGKCYAKMVEKVTGESLYDDIIFNHNIVKMAKALENYHPTDAELHEWDFTLEHFKDFARMFRKYADAEAVLISWY